MDKAERESVLAQQVHNRREEYKRVRIEALRDAIRWLDEAEDYDGACLVRARLLKQYPGVSVG